MSGTPLRPVVLFLSLALLCPSGDGDDAQISTAPVLLRSPGLVCQAAGVITLCCACVARDGGGAECCIPSPCAVRCVSVRASAGVGASVCGMCGCADGGRGACARGHVQRISICCALKREWASGRTGFCVRDCGSVTLTRYCAAAAVQPCAAAVCMC